MVIVKHGAGGWTSSLYPLMNELYMLLGLTGMGSRKGRQSQGSSSFGIERARARVRARVRPCGLYMKAARGYIGLLGLRLAGADA